MISRKQLVEKLHVSNPTIRRALKHLGILPSEVTRDGHNVPTYYYKDQVLPLVKTHIQYQRQLRSAKCPKGYAKCRGGCKQILCLASMSGAHICKDCRNQKLLKNIAYDFKPWLKTPDVVYINKAIQYLSSLLPKKP